MTMDTFNEQEELKEPSTTAKETTSKKSEKFEELPKHLRSVASNKGKYYLTNNDLLPAVIESKDKGFITDKLARMLMLLTDRYSRRANFVGYSYREDMVSSALTNLCQNALKFDPEKSKNPFAFYTTAIHHSFLQFMMDEKKQHYIRDTMLVDNGQSPSNNFKDSIVAKNLKKKKKVTKKEQKRVAAIEQKQLSDSFLEF